MGPQDVLAAYEARINSRDFGQLAPLISAEAVFWFNDGSFSSLEAIRAAFERTWTHAVDEHYWLEDKPGLPQARTWRAASIASAGRR